MRFSGPLQLQAFLGYFLLLLEINIKIVNFYAKFHIKRGKFLLSNCTSLLLFSKPRQQNCPYFFKYFKNHCALRVNGSKLTFVFKKLLLLQILLLHKVKKNLDATKSFIWGSSQSLGLFLNTWVRQTHMTHFQDFSFKHFLGTSCYFSKLRVKLLNSALNFR